MPAKNNVKRTPEKVDEKIRTQIERIRRAVNSFDETALGEVASTSRDPFRVLISCVISLRTKDEVTAAASKRLFAVADTPDALASQTENTIADLIYPAGFYRTKAKHIIQISRILLEKHGAAVPANREALLELPGVGRKTANLVLSMGFGLDAICVDTHVHRIPNRIGWIRTRTPQETETALEQVLPRKYWIPINDWLVTFGQNICKPISPLCSRCPLDGDCPKISVGRHR